MIDIRDIETLLQVNSQQIADSSHHAKTAGDAVSDAMDEAR